MPSSLQEMSLFSLKFIGKRIYDKVHFFENDNNIFCICQAKYHMWIIQNYVKTIGCCTESIGKNDAVIVVTIWKQKYVYGIWL